MSKRLWTDEEYALLEDKADARNVDLARELGRTTQEVSRKRIMLAKGWTPKVSPWTPEEDSVIISASPFATAEQLTEKLPGRTRKAVEERSRKLGRFSVAGFQKSPSHIGARPLLAKTCTKCGLLLPAGWFQWFDRKTGWSSHCRKCRSKGTMDTRKARVEVTPEKRKAYTAKYENRCQAITLPTVTKAREPYTEKDHKILSDPDMTLIQKAVLLGRTFKAIKKACFKFEYKSHVGLGDPERDLWMIQNPNAERIAEIQATQRTPEPVSTGRPAWDWDD
jgi:hypothetical protein